MYDDLCWCRQRSKFTPYLPELPDLKLEHRQKQQWLAPPPCQVCFPSQRGFVDSRHYAKFDAKVADQKAAIVITGYEFG